MFDNVYKYHLEKYHGATSRHECPNCHDHKSFVYYVDDSGVAIDATCGKCNHESHCGYHLTPKQFFDMNPSRKNEACIHVACARVEKRPVSYIPDKYLLDSRSNNNALIKYIDTLLDDERKTIASKVYDWYQVGSTRDGRIIYWQIDCNGLIRTGKVMQYNPLTGHRIQGQANAINWIHSILIKRNVLSPDYNLGQCLFGEHLIKAFPNKPIIVVEAEKTAIMCSIVMPQFNWLATGGKSQTSIEKMKALKNLCVVMMPDTDTSGQTFQRWKDLADEMTFCKSVVVSDVMEKYATQQQHEHGCDIADLIIEAMKHPANNTIGKEASTCLTMAEQRLKAMESANPLLTTLVEKLNLQLIEN